jgi:hypothetical protein
VFTLCGVLLGAAIVLAINVAGQVGELVACGPWWFNGKYYDRRALIR